VESRSSEILATIGPTWQFETAADDPVIRNDGNYPARKQSHAPTRSAPDSGVRKDLTAESEPLDQLTPMITLPVMLARVPWQKSI
jgi:hypothetical protein